MLYACNFEPCEYTKSPEGSCNIADDFLDECLERREDGRDFVFRLGDILPASTTLRRMTSKTEAGQGVEQGGQGPRSKSPLS